MPTSNAQLQSRLEPFDSIPDTYVPDDVERGYARYRTYYRANWLRFIPQDKKAQVLCVSCGAGYPVKMLQEEGYANVLGIDSDERKVELARSLALNCRAEEAFPFLAQQVDRFDAILCANEVNHLTKDELIEFLGLCRRSLRAGGTVIIHSQNGANPITGADALAHNLDHHLTLTEYSIRQALEHSGFEDVRVAPVKLYVYYRNPLNYVGMALDAALNLVFWLLFRFYGKPTRIFSKKITGVGRKAPESLGQGR